MRTLFSHLMEFATLNPLLFLSRDLIRLVRFCNTCEVLCAMFILEIFCYEASMITSE